MRTSITNNSSQQEATVLEVIAKVMADPKFKDQSSVEFAEVKLTFEKGNGWHFITVEDC